MVVRSLTRGVHIGMALRALRGLGKTAGVFRGGDECRIAVQDRQPQQADKQFNC